MSVATDTTNFQCPGCKTQIQPQQGDRQACPDCGWAGWVMLFRPLNLDVDKAEEALPEDVACVHHPTKRAMAVCAGTGDYICSLCSIEVERETFSAAHLNTAGTKKTRKMFDRYLSRPDSTVVLFLLLCFVPYVNFVWLLGAPIWVPSGYVKLARADRLRREDPLILKLVSRTRLVLLGVLLSLPILVLIAGVVTAILEA